MSRMPRITLIRALSTPVLCYLTAILIWVALPSLPSVHNGHYHQDVLRAGKPLTSVYENSPVFDSPENVDNYDRAWFAVDWQLVKDEEHDSVTLRVGSDASVNLTKYASMTAPYTDLTALGVFTVTAKSGDLDGVMMPWFAPADSCLLNWEIDRGPKMIEVRPILVEEGVIQIWPENSRWHKEPLQTPGHQSQLQPFMTITDVPTTADRTDITRIGIDDMTWQIPTLTFPIRRLILKTLKPITLTLGDVLEQILLTIGVSVFPILYLASMAGLIGVAIGTANWFKSGRPPLRPWIRSRGHLRVTRRRTKQRVIWGPGGPVAEIDDDEDDEDDIEDDDLHEQSVARGTIQTPVDFFRSRSPLDDLLNTFASTQWMLKPIFGFRRRPRHRFEPSKGGTVADSGDGEKIRRDHNSVV